MHILRKNHVLYRQVRTNKPNVCPIDLIEYLQTLPKLTSKNINYTQFGILKHICERPESTSYDIERLEFPKRGSLHRKRIREIKRKGDLSNNIDPRSIRRYITDLYEKGFIERGNNEHNAKPCRLISSGIYYLILRIMPYNVMNGIFKNYDDKLFQLFLYPYVKKDTLVRLTETTLVSWVSLFLFDCSKEIEDKHVMEIVPGRHSVLWNENENNSDKVVARMSIEEFASDFLFLSMPKRVPSFIFDLISKATAGSPDFSILSKDENLCIH